MNPKHSFILILLALIMWEILQKILLLKFIWKTGGGRLAKNHNILVEKKLMINAQSRESARLFMYRRPILCTLYNAVDFLNVLKKYIMYL